jgi:hypothetical protein
MIIAPDILRKPLIIISAILFAILTVLTFSGANLISMVDGIVLQFGRKFFPAFVVAASSPFYWLSYGIINFLLIFVIVFFMWGFKFKIPAAWLFVTNVGGIIIIQFSSMLLSHKTISGSLIYPNHAVFSAVLFANYLLVLLIPEIKSTLLAWLARLTTLLFVLLVIVYVLAHQLAGISDVTAGILLAITWFMLSEEYYVSRAAWYSRFNGFRNSWY